MNLDKKLQMTYLFPNICLNPLRLDNFDWFYVCKEAFLIELEYFYWTNISQEMGFGFSGFKQHRDFSLSGIMGLYMKSDFTSSNVR